MTDRELMKQALEALITYDGTNGEGKRKRVLAALRERLAQPEQEPVAWGVFDGPNLHDVNFTEEEAHEMVRLKGDGSVVKPLYTSTQPQMQPCAGRNCGSTNPNLHSAECFEDYEQATGMNQWVGLTDEEVSEIIDREIGFNSCWGPEEAFARAIEAKLREKNHG